jgi:hypothetical protein
MKIQAFSAAIVFIIAVMIMLVRSVLRLMLVRNVGSFTLLLIHLNAERKAVIRWCAWIVGWVVVTTVRNSPIAQSTILKVFVAIVVSCIVPSAKVVTYFPAKMWYRALH